MKMILFLLASTLLASGADRSVSQAQKESLTAAVKDLAKTRVRIYAPGDNAECVAYAKQIGRVLIDEKFDVEMEIPKAPITGGVWVGSKSGQPKHAIADAMVLALKPLAPEAKFFEITDAKPGILYIMVGTPPAP